MLFLLGSFVMIASSMASIALGASGNELLDAINFGDPSPEGFRRVKTEHAKIVEGGLGEQALQLQPLSPPSRYGGSASFTMRVDPKKQNYVTVRLWGEDKCDELSQLVLYANGKQVGYRRQSDYDLQNICEAEPFAPGRFFYETRPLPLWMTEGKKSIDLKIAALGRIWPYGTNFEQYQKPLTKPSRGIYCVYTHTDPRIEPPPDEKQGATPDAGMRDPGGSEVIEKSRRIVNNRISTILGNPSKGARINLLLEAYRTRWTPAFNNPKVAEMILAEGDNLASRFVADPKFDGGWMGAGPLGEAIVKMWPEIGNQLDAPFPPNPKAGTRREAWSKALRQSIDFWRTHRRYYTNQAMFVDGGIYRANRGLTLVDPANALPEERAIRYVYEALGIEPWRDSDIIDKNGDRPCDPFGGTYSLVTRKNLTRELGWVGSYGEVILPVAVELARFTGSEKARKQVAKLQAARLIFRYPGFDSDGNRTMKAVTEVCNRTARFPYPGPAYSAAAVREAWGMEVAALLPDDPSAVGAAQRFIADGQYFPSLEGRLEGQDTLGLMRNIEDYETVKGLADVGYKFPMEDGQPDFVFADEENGIVAIKHKGSRLFVNLYFRAETAVNSVAKIMEITPSVTRLTTVKSNTKVNESGVSVTRPDYIDYIRDDELKPPGEEIHQAWAGEVMPVSQRPEGAREPQYGDFGPFVGRAAFYWLAYGDYLIGLNTTETQTFELPVPGEGKRFLDLVTNKEIAPENGSVKVPPLSTVVLYPVKS